MIDFTEDDIVKAYEETGLQPIYGIWLGYRGSPHERVRCYTGEESSDFNCGCALTALTVARKGRTTVIATAAGTPWMAKPIGDLLGLSEKELTSFTAGFDGRPYESEWMSRKAFQLGRRTRKRVKPRSTEETLL